MREHLVPASHSNVHRRKLSRTEEVAAIRTVHRRSCSCEAGDKEEKLHCSYSVAETGTGERKPEKLTPMVYLLRVLNR